MKMDNRKATTLFPTLVFLALFQLCIVSCREINNHGRMGFTLDLIHRDSPLSPLYNPSNTPSTRLRNAFRRSFSRANSFFKTNAFATIDTIQSDIQPIPGEYLMKLSIGTPPVEILAIADTGSDLTWIQCKPCISCYQQSAPIFNSNKSSTYRTAACEDKECNLVNTGSCVGQNVCQYEMSYGDQSHSIGDIAYDKFTFPSTSGKKVAIPHVVFGCGHDNAGTFNNYTSGIIGLGGGEVSIINQLNKQINGKFSYCLIPNPLQSNLANATSHINFGRSAVVTGPKVVSTPLINKEPSTFYYLTLEGFSVGNEKVPFKSSKIASSAIGVDEGNIIIDSGTTLTFLPDDIYFNLESRLLTKINATKKEDPTGTFGLCYESENGTIDAPTIVAHFTNADLELSPSSTFAEVEKGLVCLTLVPSDQFAIFGNLAQANFLIGYDLVANKVSFKPTDCSKY